MSKTKKAVRNDFMHGIEAELRDHPRRTCDHTAALVRLFIERVVPEVLLEEKKRSKLAVAAAATGMQSRRNAKRVTTVSLLENFRVFLRMNNAGRATMTASVTASKVAVIMNRKCSGYGQLGLRRAGKEARLTKCPQNLDGERKASRKSHDAALSINETMPQTTVKATALSKIMRVRLSAPTKIRRSKSKTETFAI